jgi:uridine phosphorylase
MKMSDPSPCLIDPKKSRLEPAVDPLALLIPIPADLQAMSRLFGQAGPPCFKNSFMRVFQLSDSLRATALAGPAVGAPHAVMILEKLIALGARRVILLGWAGGLQTGLAPGDILLPDQALSEEGTSGHYSEEKRPRASFSLLQKLGRAMKEENLSFQQGPIWTTDAPYRETVQKVRAFQTQGVLGVDMETSALFTVGSFRGIETAAILIISDDLSGMTWRHGFRDHRFAEARKKVARFLYRYVLSASDS